jgi:NDMA-dependent alcohol dehydrogenase
VKTKGALLWATNQPWSVEDIEVGAPRSGEVTVQLAGCGLCHSDEHLVTGDVPVPHWPMLGGHEAAGTIVELGPGVSRFKVDDRVVIVAIPSCGQCLPCLRGHGSICDEAYRAVSGESISDNTRRYRASNGEEVSPFCHVGGFAHHVTVHEYSLVKVEKDIPMELAALVGCGVTTGWGAAVNVAEVRPGDNAVVIGFGGIGASAVLGAVHAGAERVVVIDPLAHKHKWAFELGATHCFTSTEEATAFLREDTWGVMADKVIIAPSRMEGWMLEDAMQMTGKLGTVVAVAAGDVTQVDARINISEFRGYQKTLKGMLLGGRSPKTDVTTLVDLYVAGRLPLEKLVTRRYSLDEINAGYQDMRDGKNIRGLLVYNSVLS